MEIKAAVVRAPHAKFSLEKVRLDAPRDMKCSSNS